MADMEVPMMETLKNLTENEFKSLKDMLAINYGDQKKIPFSELEKADFMDLIRKIRSYYYPNHVQELIDVLKKINKNDLAEKLRDKVETEKRKSDNPISELDGSPAKRQRLGGPAPYDGRYILSDLEDYASKNQDQLIKQLEEYLEDSGMRILKEQLAHSKLKNSFVFTARQCYELHINKDLKGFKEKILNDQKSKNIPKNILAILFSTIKSNNKRALDKKQRKDNSELKNQWNKGKVSTPVNEKTDEVVLNSSESLAHAAEETQSSEHQVPKADNSLYDEAIRISCKEKVEDCGSTLVNEKTDEGVLNSSESLAHAAEETQSSEHQVPKADNSLYDEAIRISCKEKVEDCGSTPVNEKTDEGVLNSSESLAHAAEETQSSEHQVPKADNSLYDEAIRISCKEKVEDCGSTPVNEKTDEVVLNSSESLAHAAEETQSSEHQVPKADNSLYDEAIRISCKEKVEDCGSTPVNEKTDEGVLNSSESLAHAVEETQTYESQGSNTDNGLYDEVIRIWYNKNKVEDCTFYYVGVRKHKKYECFVVENAIQFKLPDSTENGLLQILQKKIDLTPTNNLSKNANFELQFNMAVLGIQRSEAIYPMKNFITTVVFDGSFPNFEEFFKFMVQKIVLPLLALYKMMQVECLQIALSKQRDQ